MSKPLCYLPEAAGDVGEAYVYYEERVTGLGDEFLEQLRIRTTAIRENPEMYGVLRDNVRAAPLRRFPYVIYYRSDPSETVILAVLHGRRNPKIWGSRARQ